MFKFVRNGVIVCATTLAMLMPANAGSLSSPWDEPEVQAPPCTPMGIFYTTLYYDCGVPNVPYIDRDTPETTPTGTPDVPTDTPDQPTDPDTPDPHDPTVPDKPTDKPKKPKDKVKKPKANASNHASEKAGNNNGKGGKQRDTSRNNDKGTHGNRSPD